MPNIRNVSNLKTKNPKCNCLFAFGVSMLIFFSVLATHTAASTQQPAQHENLVQEYSEHMGYAKNQVLDLSINNSVLKLSINECSFCGALKNEKVRSDMAHKTLNWFLKKTGQQEGTVEWYNKSRKRILVITGSSGKAAITTGPSCAIQSNQSQ